jgi:hypothetical protein
MAARPPRLRVRGEGFLRSATEPAGDDRHEGRRPPPRTIPAGTRAAQAMGLGFSGAALVLWFGFSEHAATWVLLGMLLAAASLEAFLGFCLGCRVFAVLMRIGVIPEAVCESCSDLGIRTR